MKNKLRLGGLLVLLALFAVSCQQKEVLDEVNPNQTENSKLKTGVGFEFGIELFTQDEPNGPTVPASGSITIESESLVIYTGELTEGINRIQTSNEANYTILIEKDGYVTYQHDFTYEELDVYKIQRYTNPLVVVLENSNLAVSLIGTYGIVGKETEISISTNYLQAKRNVSSYQLELSYAPNYLSYSGYNLTGTLDDGATVSIIDDNNTGTLTIVSNSASILSGEGNLINLEFTTQLQGTTTLNVNSFSYNSGEVTDLNSININVYRYGDIDNDGIILMQDVAIVGNYLVDNPIAGISIPWEAWRIEVADVDGDLDVDNDDMFLILNFWQGGITEFPVESNTN